MRYNNHSGRQFDEQTCNHCGGLHDNVPTVDYDRTAVGLVADCPHCGKGADLDADDPDDLETHPAVPDGEPMTMLCMECNGSYYVRL